MGLSTFTSCLCTCRLCAIKAIEDVDTSMADACEIPKLQEEIKQAQVMIKQITNFRTRKSKLTASREGCEKQIRDYCNIQREMLNDLEKKMLEELGTVIDEKNTKLKSDIHVCECIENDLEQLQHTEDEEADQATIFLRIKRDQEWLRENKPMLENMECERSKEDLVFVPDRTIGTALSSLRKLGMLRRRPTAWKAKNKQELNVKTKKEYTCQIGSIVQLQNGCFVIADEKNKCVKQLNKDYNVINTCPLAASPNDICCVGASEVAVSLRNKTIQFISVDDGLTPSRSITLDYDCFGVAHKDGNLYVTDTSKYLFVYSQSGCRRQTCSMNKNGPFNCIAFSLDGNLMYATDKRGLVTLDMHGNKLATFQSGDLKNADGVCVAEDGSVIVSGLGKVIQLTAEGDNMVGVVMPYAGKVICIDRNRSKLLVAPYSGYFSTSENMNVFDLVAEDI